MNAYRSPRRGRAVSVALIVASAIAGSYLLWPKPASVEPARVVAEAPPIEAHVAAPMAMVAASPAPSVDPQKPVIDAIEVEKTSVCAGEENLIRVRAHADEANAYLRTMVGGQSGSVVPLRVWDDGRAGHDWPKIIVTGKDGAVTMADVPPFEVRSCTEARRIALTYRMEMNAPSVYRFQATLPPSAKNTEVRGYLWDFGDGQTKETPGPTVSHDFGERDQSTLVSSLVVKVQAITSGEPYTGRTALELRNDAFTAMDESGVVLLSPRFEPRFPVLGDDGVVRQKVRLRHATRGTVSVRKVTERELGRDGTLGAPRELDPSAFFGARVIESGAGTTFEATLDTHARPDVAGIEITVEGMSDSGIAAYGTFSILRPGGVAEEKRQAIDDPALAQKIRRAQEILKKDSVTEAELTRLEEDGKFEDLRTAER